MRLGVKAWGSVLLIGGALIWSYLGKEQKIKSPIQLVTKKEKAKVQEDVKASPLQKVLKNRATQDEHHNHDCSTHSTSSKNENISEAKKAYLEKLVADRMAYVKELQVILADLSDVSDLVLLEEGTKKLFAAAPTVKALSKLTTNEVHHTPLQITDFAGAVGELWEKVDKSPELTEFAVIETRKCVKNEKFPNAIRALCLTKVWGHEKSQQERLSVLEFDQEIVTLARLVQ